MPRTPSTDISAEDTRTRARNKQLRERFPPRPVPESWPQTTQTLQDTVARLTSPPFRRGGSDTGRPAPRRHQAAALAVRLELVDTQRRVHVRGGQKKVDSYLRPDALGIVPDDAPHTVR
jgi:hypothetical protein